MAREWTDLFIVDTEPRDGAPLEAEPAAAEKRRERNNQVPSAASGNGTSTQRLKPRTSFPIRRARIAGGRNIWCIASEYAACPFPA